MRMQFKNLQIQLIAASAIYIYINDIILDSVSLKSLGYFSFFSLSYQRVIP
jgi:hypothetical protein